MLRLYGTKTRRGDALRTALFGFGLLAGAAILALPALNEAAGAPAGGRDLKVCIDLIDVGAEHEIWSDVDVDEGADYCGSVKGISAFVGRARSITLSIGDTRKQTRRIKLTLGEPGLERLPDIPGDPNWAGGPADWSNHPLPEIPEGGIIAELQVAYRVNVFHMGEPGYEPNPLERLARFTWDDGEARWRLHWGGFPQPGGGWFTNPDAPNVRVTRRDDGNGNLLNEWEVTTLGDTDETPERLGAASAFLYREPHPNSGGLGGYWGVFDVSFEFVAVEDA